MILRRERAPLVGVSSSVQEVRKCGGPGRKVDVFWSWDLEHVDAEAGSDCRRIGFRGWRTDCESMVSASLEEGEREGAKDVGLTEQVGGDFVGAGDSGVDELAEIFGGGRGGEEVACEQSGF